MRKSKKVLVISSLLIVYIVLYNICSFANTKALQSKSYSTKAVVSDLVLGDEKVNNGKDESSSNSKSKLSTKAGNGSGSGSSDGSEKVDEYVESETSPTETSTEFETKTELVEKPTEVVTEKTDVVSKDDIPYLNKTETIGYITCKSANLYDAEITLGADQWVIDNYDICMAQDYSSSNYFGEGHSVLLAGHNNNSLSGLCNVSEGDLITVNTVYGGKFTYRVSYSSVVYNSNNQTLLDMSTNEPVVEFNGSSDVLQLYTCADNLGYDLNYRYFVKANLVKELSSKVV